MENYISTSKEQGIKFYQTFNDKGKLVMLNLLRFRKIADYSGYKELEPANEISGAEAYDLYIQHTITHLKEVDAKVLFFGDAGRFLIGPGNEHWDAVLLVEHQSVQQFLQFAKNEDYLKGAGHRTAALEDSRLLPMTQRGVES